MSDDEGQLVPLASVARSGCGVTRRRFCAAAGGVVALGVAGCGVGSSRIALGGLDDDGGASGPAPGVDAGAADLSRRGEVRRTAPPRQIATPCPIVAPSPIAGLLRCNGSMPTKHIQMLTG